MVSPVRVRVSPSAEALLVGAFQDRCHRDFRAAYIEPEALLRAAPGRLSAEALLRAVWDENADPFTKTVQVTIGRLRRKLGPPDAIRTTPGVGYGIDDAGD